MTVASAISSQPTQTKMEADPLIDVARVARAEQFRFPRTFFGIGTATVFVQSTSLETLTTRCTLGARNNVRSHFNLKSTADT